MLPPAWGQPLREPLSLCVCGLSLTPDHCQRWPGVTGLLSGVPLPLLGPLPRSRLGRGQRWGVHSPHGPCMIPAWSPHAQAAGRPSPGSQLGTKTVLLGRGCEQAQQGLRGAVPAVTVPTRFPCTWFISDLRVGCARECCTWTVWLAPPVCPPGSSGHGGG